MVASKSLSLSHKTVNQMKIRQIKSIVSGASDVPAVLDAAGIPFEKIANVDWPDKYPYKPDAVFRIAYTKTSLLIHYMVTEDSIRARYGDDNGHVWTDSCVEFFCQPKDDGIYYNLETNCIGTVLLGAGTSRHGRELANIETLGAIQRCASLGRRPFEERVNRVSWQLALIVPLASFFKHRIRSIEGKTIQANVYKCGDELQKPHYLSWNKIDLPKPDFHCPQYFAPMEFQP